jgi:chromosome partitioning protein
MPLVVTLLHQKGGVGKSTLATNLRSYFAGGGYRTALVDIDPQGSLTRLVRAFAQQEGREPENLIERSSFAGYGALQKKLADYDIAVVDTPPYLSKALIPCKSSPLDLLAIGDTLDLVRATQSAYPSLQSAVVLTMTISGTDFTQQIREQLEGFGFPVMKTEIANRVAYMRSLLRANSVLDDDNRKAREEIESLGAELISLMQKGHADE